MERAMLERHLIEAEGHARLGAAHIRRQHEIIRQLEAAAADTVQARRLLENFQASQELHLAHIERIRTELGLNPPYASFDNAAP